jgi:uncharacterized protein YjiS (DUF1127 family)
LSGSTSHQSDDFVIPRLATLAIGASATEAEGEQDMEMHSRQSLSEIHGISVAPRLRSRRPSIARLAIARIPAFLKALGTAIEAELAARQAITELASMNDHMLRDLGISRCEIENAVRRPREKIGTDDTPVFLNDAGGSCKIGEGSGVVAPNPSFSKTSASL